MLRGLAHRLAAQPAIYNAIQRAAGVETVLRRVREATAELPKPARVIDIGGGTGMLRDLWPEETAYINLEPDPQKLVGFRAASPQGLAVCADGAALPVAGDACDVITIQFVLHHVDEHALGSLLAECRRVIRSGGHLVVVEPLWEPARWAGRLLWRYDQGRYPRTTHALRARLDTWGTITRWDHFAIYHAYALAVIQAD